MTFSCFFLNQIEAIMKYKANTTTQSIDVNGMFSSNFAKAVPQIFIGQMAHACSFLEFQGK